MHRPLLLVSAVLLLALPAAGRADAGPEDEVRVPSSREAAWLFGVRFVEVGLARLDVARGAAEAERALERLQAETGVRVRPYPEPTGDPVRDPRRLATFFLAARPKIAAVFEERFDASHAALFRVALDGEVLSAAHPSGPELARQALQDMEAALVFADIPAPLLLPVRLAYDGGASREVLAGKIRVFDAEVRLRLRAEETTRTPGRFLEDPPRALLVWMLGVLTSNATVLHVYGKSAERPEITEALEDIADALDVPAPELPAPVPGSPRKTAQRIDVWLSTAWPPQVVDRLEHRHAGPEPHLFALALDIGRLRLGYAPGEAAKHAAAQLELLARFAELPRDLLDPLTKRMRAGASFPEVAAMLDGVSAQVSRHLARRPARDGADDPEALVRTLMLAARLDDPVQILALLRPEQRSKVALEFGLGPLLIRLKVLEQMLPLALGAEDRAKAQREVDALKQSVEGLLREHGIDEAALAGPDGDADAAARGRALLEKIDPGRFLFDARALRLRQGGVGPDDPYAWSKLVPRFFQVERGDGGRTATAMMEGRPDRLRMARTSGRWYADPASFLGK